MKILDFQADGKKIAEKLHKHSIHIAGKSRNFLKKRVVNLEKPTSRENHLNTFCMKKLVSIFAFFVTIPLWQSCGFAKPSSFVRATDGGTWSSIFIREDLT
ncbi:MAG: hypothetical protein LBB64_01360 [Dysgonamonadaceae bacterium]|jgi:hypothetical protein|nr:hypothetical protein [Dysgonamonadaceae bacterium]